MVATAIVATALGGSAAGPSKSLYVDGTDVLRQPGTPGGLYGVPLDSIEHTENGPPGVSALKFVIRDPLKAITLARGQWVRYRNHATDRDYFLGWIQTWSVKPDGLGRLISVRCIGVEALLDWSVVPSLTIPTGTEVDDAVQMCAANAELPPGTYLRAFKDHNTLAPGFGGQQDGPIAGFSDFTITSVATIAPVVIVAKTLRESINAVFAAAQATGFDEFAGVAVVAQFLGVSTVDVTLGLRCYGKTAVPSDYATLTVTDTFAGALAADGLGHQTDVGEVPSAVFVQGGNAAGTGMVSAGDGLAGPIRVISDSTITTAAGKRAAGQAYLADAGAIPERGGFSLQDVSIVTNVRAGSALILTDAETGATGTYKVAQIVRTFTSLRESWRVTYGSLPPSLPRSLRRLTRSLLS